MTNKFLEYCCLYNAISQLSKDAGMQDLLNLVGPCYVGDQQFEQWDEITKIRQTVRFFQNATYDYTKCPKEAVNDVCDAPTSPGYIFYLCVWAFILAMIVFSNLLVITSIFKVPNLRSNIPNLFIMSLSFSDLCVGLFLIPIKIGFTKSNMRFCYSLSVCHFYIIADTACFVTSIMNLLVIAVDRHFAVNYPRMYQTWMTRRRAKIIIAFTWLYGGVCGGLTNVKFDNINEEPIGIKGMNCSMYNNYIYVWILYILHFVIPVIVMGMIYFRIFTISKRFAKSFVEASVFSNIFITNNTMHDNSNNKNSNDTTNNSNNDSNNNNNSSSNDDDNNNNSNNNHKIKPDGTAADDEFVNTEISTYSCNLQDLSTTKITPTAATSTATCTKNWSIKSMGQYQKLVLKASKTVATVCGTFVTCWLPVCVFSIALNVCRPCFEKVNIWFYIICVELLPMINSMLNVFIYAITNSQFRKGFKTMLRGGGKDQKTQY